MLCIEDMAILKSPFLPYFCDVRFVYCIITVITVTQESRPAAGSVCGAVAEAKKARGCRADILASSEHGNAFHHMPMHFAN